MQGNSVLDGVQTQRKTGRTYPASRLTTMLAALALSFGVAAQAADAQSAVAAPISVAVASNSIGASMNNSTSDSTRESTLPSLSDIAAMLRAQFRVAPMESMKIARAVLTEADRHAISHDDFARLPRRKRRRSRSRLAPL